MFDFVSHSHVSLEGFWADRQTQVRDTTIPYQWEALNDRVPGADASGAVKNIKIAAGKTTGEFEGFFFQDSDVAKWIEAVAYALSGKEDPVLERKVDRLIKDIIAGQDEDGYLNTYYTIAEKPGLRWSDLRDKHEMYVTGHMLEAAIAYFESTGKRDFLDAMIENVVLIRRRFGPRKSQVRGYPGHPEIELALVRLYELTRDDRHLRLSKYFIDERGQEPRYFDDESKRLGKKDYRSDEWYAIYNQSHLPIREQTEVVGHAVRACYLFAAAADVARLTGDSELFDVIKALWENATERRMYLTGGVGSTLLGEAFTFDYDLPNEWAYTETCAAIGLILWCQRMLKHEANGRYADVMEKVLYNGFLSALSSDGTHCFYRNPLVSVPDPKYPKRHMRRAWHECACCPPNVSRLMMSLGGYMYSVQKRSVYLHLYAAGEATIEIEGDPIQIKQVTDFPFDGAVSLTIATEAEKRFRLAIRIPGWSRGATITLNGESVDPPRRDGYALLTRAWSDGDTVEINLPMVAERIYSHPKVRQNVDRVALQRGPFVYCLEEADNGGDLHDIVLPRSAELDVADEETEWGTLPLISADAARKNLKSSGSRLYRTDGRRRSSPTRIKAIPYFLWANRGMAEMSVWLRDVDDSSPAS